MVVKLISFTKNNVNSSFQNANENTYDILNGGSTHDSELIYTFNITGLQGHSIESIKSISVLYNEDGTYASSKNAQIELTKDQDNAISFSGNIIQTAGVKTPFTIEFKTTNTQEESNSINLTYKVKSSEDFYYGLSGLIITLSDVLEEYRINFQGPLTNRTISSITVAAVKYQKGTVAVSFSQNPTVEFNALQDGVPGRVYFRQEGIYVDGYQYGTVATATTQTKGIVALQHNFKVDDNGAIIVPNEVGVAASPQLVYNAVGNLKNYTDQLFSGVPAIKIEDETKEDLIPIEDELIFSTDFQIDENNKIYLNWKEFI